MSTSAALPAPSPLAGSGQPVDWMFAFKFNAATVLGTPDDGTTPPEGSPGIFGGIAGNYPNGHNQQYVFATSSHPTLVQGSGFIGATLQDPVGATFAQIYEHPGYSYVLWNDQFYNNPLPNLDAPWGHSKGLVAWNEQGEGLVLQVSTPSWPAAGSSQHPRQNDGNTLGFIHDDDIEVSQHFFAVKLTPADLAVVLAGLANASVGTSLAQPSLVQNGGPAHLQALVKKLGTQTTGHACTLTTLSTGIQFLAKPSGLQAPPWQLVSAKLGGLPLRVASWWQDPQIYSTPAGEVPLCWATGLGTPGPVDIATNGNWQGIVIGLQGGDGPNFNHAKIGVSTDPAKPICIFGDLNQQGALTPNYSHPGQTCDSSQNGRGGTFYVINHPLLYASVAQLLQGASAPVKGNT
jgi:Deoxyribonuclease II